MKLSQDAEPALLELLKALDREQYDFVTPTPATHQRVVARPSMQEARDLRGVFGWSLPFAAELLPRPMLDLLERANVVREEAGLLKSRIRVSRLLGKLFIHSAFPTKEEDAVFFGPDTYRFAHFVRAELGSAAGAKRLVDIGAGGGPGGITAAAMLPNARITLFDTNPTALRLASVNARHAGVEAELVEGQGIDDLSGAIDLAIANPPYVMDEDDRTYRSGGDMHGAQISLDWTLAAARRLEPGGRMLLYTGVAIVAGRDALREALERELPGLGCSLSYREIDPDIFGEELEKPLYADVERIAAIGAVVEAAD